MPTMWAGGRNWPRKCKSDRKSTRLNSSHLVISYAVFCLKKSRREQDADHVIGGELVTGHHLGDQFGRRVEYRVPVGGIDLYRTAFFFNDTATTEIYPLSLHDALPI